MAGRKGKPLSQQVAQGDPRKLGKRKLAAKAKAVPEPSRGIIDCPRHLKGRARSTWIFWKAELEDMNLDKRPDAQMLEGACVQYARAVKADIQIDRCGLTIKVFALHKGKKIALREVTNPAIHISNQAWRLVHSFCSDFGLSPAARTRLAIEQKGSDADDLAALLAEPRATKPLAHVN